MKQWQGDVVARVVLQALAPRDVDDPESVTEATADLLAGVETLLDRPWTDCETRRQRRRSATARPSAIIRLLHRLNGRIHGPRGSGAPDAVGRQRPRLGLTLQPTPIFCTSICTSPDIGYCPLGAKDLTEPLQWSEVDEAGGVVRLSPERSKTRQGRLLPISAPIADLLGRRRTLRRAGESRVFNRDHTTVRAWRRAWPEGAWISYGDNNLQGL